MPAAKATGATQGPQSPSEATSTEPPNPRSLQGRKGAAVRWRLPERDQIARDYAAARIAAFIERELKNAPPLTDAQRAEIGSMFVGGDK